MTPWDVAILGLRGLIGRIYVGHDQFEPTGHG